MPFVSFLSHYTTTIVGYNFFLFLFFFVGTQINAQETGAIRGRIFDRETGDPLPGANVIIQGTSIGAAADLEGEFYVRNAPAGERTVRVSYLGYQTLSIRVIIPTNDILEQDFRLTAQALEGETVIVTAQARGQNTAINQQLASNTISNIVAADRIKELPDVSAAESIGRLPGISIERYNGEATAVGIRGLAPKYNTITVNGVALPATDFESRTVDLSLISSNVLDGIEVKKANTPDMDADALGGTVDLRLREAPEEFQFNGTIQGGYNQLQNYYGNYNSSVSISNRFFDNVFGVIAGFNMDRNNRTADKLNANYTTVGDQQNASDVRVTNFILRRDEAFKKRYGGSLLLDYKIPFGKISANGFFNKATTEGIYREDNMDFSHHSHYYNVQANEASTTLFTSSGGLAQDFGWIKYDAGFSATGSETDDPLHYEFQFAQENNADKGDYPPANTPLTEAYTYENAVDSMTGMQYVLINSTKLIEKQKTAQLNFQLPFNFTEDVSGYLKIGGKFKWLNRTFNRESWGHHNLQYGTYWTNLPGQIARAGAVMYPGEFNREEDSLLLTSSKGGYLISRFFRGYYPPSNFLDGKYKMRMTPDVELMKKVANIMQSLGTAGWQLQPLNSFGRDYDGIERYQAAYIMAEINLGPYITLIPGVRYDADYTKYHGQTFQEVVQAGEARIPNLIPNENVRENIFWLPMVHLKLTPFEWLNVRLARTETITRPDFLQYAPITTMDQYSSNVQAANASLRNSRSKNLDASISVHQSYLGFFTVSGFYKEIDDLIFWQGTPRVDSTIYKRLNADLNIPIEWFKLGTPYVNTYLNNPTPAFYRGIEFDWQTNFWYLPSFLKGLVFNINWAYITSKVDIKQYRGNSATEARWDSVRRRWVPFTYTFMDSTQRSQRMPGQPTYLLNTTIGYDLMGFSIRVTYLYQSDKITSVGQLPLTDGFTAKYGRWDILIQQKITEQLQLYANINNLNKTHDESRVGNNENNPTSLQYYGQTMDVGIRLKF